jgi:hypothetical protein
MTTAIWVTPSCPRGHQLHTVAIGIGHPQRLRQALSCDHQLAVTAGRCLRQRLRMMVELDDGALLVMPVLFLSATHRLHMIEADRGILLPKPQHRLQMVGRKSDVDDVFRQLHPPHP